MPVAVTEKVALRPTADSWLIGCTVIAGAALTGVTVSVALLLVTEVPAAATTTE